MRVVAEGWFCTTCDTFEQEDEVDATTDVCVACGCYGADHFPVEIVTKGLT